MNNKYDEILAPGTKMIVTKGCPKIGWLNGMVVFYEKTTVLKDGGLLATFKTNRGVRSLYPSGGNARGLKILSFNNGNPNHNIRMSVAFSDISLDSQRALAVSAGSPYNRES
jgi:hypothetical protein